MSHTTITNTDASAPHSSEVEHSSTANRRDFPFQIVLTHMSSMTEAAQTALVRATLAGDSAAFTTLYEYMAPLLRGVASRIVPEGDIDDIVQETMLKAYTHLSGFDGRSRFSTWCTRIGVNEAVMRRRKITREQKYVAGSLDETFTGWDGDEAKRFPEPVHEDRDLEMKLLFDHISNVTLTRMNQDQRTAMIMRSEGATDAEIGKALGKTIPAVKAIIHRARKLLKESYPHQKAA